MRLTLCDLPKSHQMDQIRAEKTYLNNTISKANLIKRYQMLHLKQTTAHLFICPKNIHQNCHTLEHKKVLQNTGFGWKQHRQLCDHKAMKANVDGENRKQKKPTSITRKF